MHDRRERVHTGSDTIRLRDCGTSGEKGFIPAVMLFVSDVAARQERKGSYDSHIICFRACDLAGEMFKTVGCEGDSCVHIHRCRKSRKSVH